MAHDMSASLGHRALQCRRTIRQQRRCRNFVSHHPEFKSNVTQSQSFGSAKWVKKKSAISAILQVKDLQIQFHHRKPLPTKHLAKLRLRNQRSSEIIRDVFLTFSDLLSDDLTFGVQEMWRVSEWMNHDSMTTVVGQLNNPLRLGCTHCEALPTMSQFVPKISGQSWRDVKIMGKLSDIPVFEISSERTALSQWKQRILQPENLRCWQSPEDCSCHVLEACPISKFCYNTQRTQQSNKVHQRALLCHKKKSWTSKKRSELL